MTGDAEMHEHQPKQQKPALMPNTEPVETTELDPEHGREFDFAAPRAAASPPIDPQNVRQILRLQSLVGNQAVQRMLQQPAFLSPSERYTPPVEKRYLIHRFATTHDALQREVETPGGAPDAGWQPVNKIGLVYKDEGANLRDQPLPDGEGSTIVQNLPQNTKVLLLKHNPAADAKWYSIRVMGGAYDGLSGYLADWLVRDDLPDPEAVMYRVQQGDQLGRLVQNHPLYQDYPIQLGDDARSLVMAVYMANRNNGGVTLNPQRAEKPWYADVWDAVAGAADDYRDELAPIYQMAELTAGKLIWLPGKTYIAALKDANIIPGRPGWKNVAIEVVKGIGGFTVGIVEGFIGSIVDLVVGVFELGKSIVDAIISVYTGAALEKAQEVYDYFTEVAENPAMLRELAEQIVSALVSAVVGSVESFLTQWNAPNPYDAWNFRGKVIGYILAELLMLYFSGGVSAAKWLGKLGKLGRILLKIADKIEDGMGKIPGLKRRKRRDRDGDDGDDGETGDRLKALAKARVIAEAHDAGNSPILVALGALEPLKAQHKGVRGFVAKQTAPGHYQIIMRAVVDPDYTPGADNKQQPTPAPAHRLINALRGFSGGTYRFGPNTVLLDRSGMKHILERHHPKYWDGSVKAQQSFFDANLSIADVQNAIEEVLKQNRDFLAKPTSGDLYRQIQGTVNGKKYVLGLNHNRVGQFYPPGE